jgi:hypothetical protein
MNPCLPVDAFLRGPVFTSENCCPINYGSTVGENYIVLPF